jgi:hypothetical protein
LDRPEKEFVDLLRQCQQRVLSVPILGNDHK